MKGKREIFAKKEKVFMKTLEDSLTRRIRRRRGTEDTREQKK